MIRSYIQKPIMIQAYKVEEFDYTAIANFVGNENLSIEKGKVYVLYKDSFNEIKLGDYIIKDIKGEFYPCKSHIFEETYESSDA